MIDISNILASINWNEKTDLCEIMKNNGSDKSTRHNYTVLYSKLFENLKNNTINLFELGIGSNNTKIPSNMGSNATIGASLYGWCEYFTHADIFAADIDENCMVTTDRITTYQVDSTDSSSIKMMLEKLPEFDIIIDDGLHEFSSNSLFLEESFNKLKKGGIYVIEDILDSQLYLFEEFLNSEILKNVQFKKLIKIPINIISCDNNIILLIK